MTEQENNKNDLIQILVIINLEQLEQKHTMITSKKNKTQASLALG